jgi:hypothetical protein
MIQNLAARIAILCAKKVLIAVVEEERLGRKMEKRAKLLSFVKERKIENQ